MATAVPVASAAVAVAMAVALVALVVVVANCRAAVQRQKPMHYASIVEHFD